MCVPPRFTSCNSDVPVRHTEAMSNHRQVRGNADVGDHDGGRWAGSRWRGAQRKGAQRAGGSQIRSRRLRIVAHTQRWTFDGAF